MSLCASCGSQLPDGEGLCRHHASAFSDDWARSNRILCDFIHRKAVPVRLALAERDDDFWAYIGDGG